MENIGFTKDSAFHTGGGCTAIHYDFGGWTVLVTNDDASAPTDDELERGDIMIGVYEGEEMESDPKVIVLHGRKGLNQWYRETVGYEPDESGALPIGELLDLIVGYAVEQQREGEQS